jgi:hypothetical protein
MIRSTTTKSPVCPGVFPPLFEPDDAAIVLVEAIIHAHQLAHHLVKPAQNHGFDEPSHAND